MTANHWPAPGDGEPIRLTWGKYVLWFIGLFAVALFVVASIQGPPADEPAANGGSFYASAGWTVQRAADLSVKIRRDDGASKAIADCAMRELVGGRTWLEWQALGAYGQLTAIRAAEAGCR